jgi:conjugative transposon TraN protein
MILLLFAVSTSGLAQTQDSNVWPNRPLIGVSTQKTSLLVFTYPIEVADMGSSDILARPLKTGSRILKIKAAKSGFDTTSLSVQTKDGKLYSMLVYYDSIAGGQVHLMDSSALPTQKTVAHEPITLAEMEQLVQEAAQQPARYFYRPARKFKMLFRFKQVLYKQDLLFFVFQIHNYSHIPYDLHFTRIYQRDRQRAKRSSQTEKEITPVYHHCSAGDRIDGQQSATLVLVFDKFTMADHKKMVVELYEKNGDRVVRLPISGASILRASSW